MDYRKFGETYYIRMDKGDEIISTILGICQKEQIASAIFSGIGGCRSAEIQTFIPETGSFEVQELKGMLELVSLTGNIVSDDDGTYFHHTHAAFSYKQDGEHHVAAGHIIMGPLSRPRSKILRVAVSRIILSSEASKVKLVGNLVA